MRGYLVGSRAARLPEDRRGAASNCPLAWSRAANWSIRSSRPANCCDIGEHDLNIDFQAVVDQFGPGTGGQASRGHLDIYFRASSYAEARGVILADTKFEFGLDKNNNPVLADEVLTPDSSRYWPVDSYKAGAPQPSFD